MCADVGKTFDDLARPQRLALWHTLLDGCRRAVAAAESDNQDPKVFLVKYREHFTVLGIWRALTLVLHACRSHAARGMEVWG